MCVNFSDVMCKNGPDCSEPLMLNRFDSLEVSHRIRMSAEVKLQALHIIQLSG